MIAIRIVTLAGLISCSRDSNSPHSSKYYREKAQQRAELLLQIQVLARAVDPRDVLLATKGSQAAYSSLCDGAELDWRLFPLDCAEYAFEARCSGFTFGGGDVPRKCLWGEQQ